MAHHFDISDIQHEGWLVKKALSFGKDNWKKRYFRLQGQRLSYYEDSKTPLNKHKGVLIITADTRVREIPGGYHHGRMHELEVTFPKTKEVLYAVADDMDEIRGPNGWVARLQEVIDALQPAPTAEQQALRDAKEAAARAAAEAAQAASAQDQENRKAVLDQLRANEEERKRHSQGARTPTTPTTPSTPDAASGSSSKAYIAGVASLKPLKSAGGFGMSRSFSTGVGAGVHTPRLGTMYIWGGGDSGTIGDGSIHQDGVMRPTENITLRANNAASRVAAGVSHAAALTNKGGLFLWGTGSDGQLGASVTTHAPRPFIMPAFRDRRVTAVACGDTQTLVVAEGGMLYAWGTGREGQLGLGPEIQYTLDPLPIHGPLLGGISDPTATFSKVFAGRYTSAAVTAKGAVVMWGNSGDFGRLGFGPDWAVTGAVAWQPYEVPVVNQPYMTTIQVICGDTYTAFLTAKLPYTFPGQLYLTGLLGVPHEQFAQRKAALTYPHVTGLFGEQHLVAALAGGSEHLICVADGSVYTFGRGYLGGSASDKSEEPVAVGQLDNETVAEVAAGDQFSVVRTATGRLYAWGANDCGQLGVGTRTSVLRPTLCSGLTGLHYERVICGSDFVVGLAFPGEPGPAPPMPTVTQAEVAATPTPTTGSPDGSGGEGEREKVRADRGLLTRRQSWRSKSAATAAQIQAALAAQAVQSPLPPAAPAWAAPLLSPISQTSVDAVAQSMQSLMAAAAVPTVEVEAQVEDAANSHPATPSGNRKPTIPTAAKSAAKASTVLLAISAFDRDRASTASVGLGIAAGSSRASQADGPAPSPEGEVIARWNEWEMSMEKGKARYINSMTGEKRVFPPPGFKKG